MKTIAKITKRTLYNKNVIDLELSSMRGFHGTLSIVTTKDGYKNWTGEHGPTDYEKEYGFILKVKL